MKNFFKTTLLFLLIPLFFQECISNETSKDINLKEQKLTIQLSKKLITHVNFTRDIDLINYTCTETNTGLSFYFQNPQGDFYSAKLSILDWEINYPKVKELAYQKIGVRFIDDDFFINYLVYGSENRLYKRNNIIDYFENCRLDMDLFGSDYSFNDSYFEGVFISEINFNCNVVDGISGIFKVDDYLLFPIATDTRIQKLNIGILENQLAVFNQKNNTSYIFEDIKIIGLIHPGTSNLDAIEAKNRCPDVLFRKEQILNYFNNCSFERDINIDNYLNFVYPIQINRSSQLGKVTNTIQNNQDLITIHKTN
jgi:hypothetical protein